MNAAHHRTHRSRRPLWLLVLLFFAPLLGAFWLYYGSPWRPAGQTNHGELIQPVRALPGRELRGADTATRRPFDGKWSLVYVGDGRCEADCRRALHLMRQTHLALGRQQTRVQQVLLATSGCCDRAYLDRAHPGLRLIDASGAPDVALIAAFPREHPRRGIYVVDPLGNLMMRYDTALEPRGLLLDLKRLLELSHIG